MVMIVSVNIRNIFDSLWLKDKCHIIRVKEIFSIDQTNGDFWYCQLIITFGNINLKSFLIVFCFRENVDLK